MYYRGVTGIPFIGISTVVGGTVAGYGRKLLKCGSANYAEKKRQHVNEVTCY